MTLTDKIKQRAYQTHQERIDHLLLESITNHDTEGSNIQRLEKALSEYVGADEAIVCNSQFNAFILIFMVLGLKAGDEVITSPLSSGIAVQAAIFMGAKVIFVDVNATRFTLDIEQVEDAITERTKLIIPISLLGNIADMERINALALQHDLCVIEDAAESFGGAYNGTKSTQLSKLATTSFYPSMPLHGFGNGAALFIEDKELRAKARLIRSQGKKGMQYVSEGIEACMDPLQAAVVAFKLSILDEEITIRKDMAQKYAQAFKDAPFHTPVLESESNFAYYPLLLKERAAFLRASQKEDIDLHIPFETPLHLHPAFAFMDYREGDFPNSETIAKQLLLLPLSAYLSEEEQDQVINILNTI